MARESRFMRLAFFVLMHSNPEQAGRLLKRLDNGDNLIFVHVDDRAPDEVYDHIVALVRGRKQIHFVKRHFCRWGGFGIVQGTFECLRAALGCGVSFDYGILLSGQDYPIQPLDRLTAMISASATPSEFIESFRLDRTNRWTDRSGVYRPMNKISWISVPIRGRWLHIPIRRRLPLDLKPYGGSQWWCLSRECLAYIDDFVDRRPAVLRYFRNVFIPDESIFQTIVSNSPFGERICCDDLRYIDWERPNPNVPRTLDVTDLERMRASNKPFARKFDMKRDSDILDLIDKELLGR